MFGVVTGAAVPETVMLGFVAALDWTVKVAEREPAFSGLSNVAPIVQVAPAFTVTEAPTGTQVPVALKSVAFAPLFSMPVIVSFSVPLFVNVMVDGVDVELVARTGVDAKLSVVPLAVIAGCASAAHDATASAVPTSALNMFVLIDVVGMFIDFAFRLQRTRCQIPRSQAPR